jgi:hypothetical protein
LSVTLSVVEKFLDESRLDVRIDDLIAQKTGRGRPRQLSVRALLVGLTLNAQGGRSHLTRVTDTLNALPTSTRRRLGITRSTPVTYRQVTRLFDLICWVIDSPQERNLDGRLATFDDLCTSMAFYSAHPLAREASSIALDATDIPTWGTNRRRKKDVNGVLKAHPKHRRDGRQVFTDPDAGVRAAFRPKAEDRAKGNTLPARPPLYGYELTTATVVPELRGADVPFATTALRLRPAAKATVEMGLAVTYEHARMAEKIGDVLFDRGYNHALNGSDFIGPLRALGAEPVFELQPNQLGTHGFSRGALIIDGHPFSPTVPKHLHQIEPPSIKADSLVIKHYQDQIALRSKWAMETHGARKPSGAQVFICPAQAGKVKCALASGATPRPGAIKVFPASITITPDSVCTRKFSTFDFADAPLAQRDLFGSKDWFSSYSRRNRVEGFYGNLKDVGRENMRRGSIRVVGIVKTGLLLSLAVASVNLRMAAKWDREHDHRGAKSPRRGRPAKAPMARHEEVLARAASLVRVRE